MRHPFVARGAVIPGRHPSARALSGALEAAEQERPHDHFRQRDAGELTKCIRTDMDCADVCNAIASVLSRHTGYDANITRAVLHACATVCKACGDECASHADMQEHCRVCADACRRCEQACNDLLAGLG